MNTLVLYITTVLIWGSTWLAIRFQLGEVNALLSVSYRFGLAACALLLFCWLRRKSMSFSVNDHVFIFLQGACLFGFNYWLFYLTTEHISSGLVAVIGSSMVFMNIVNGRLFLGKVIQTHVVFAALLGVMGICLVFWPELQQVGNETEQLTLALVLGFVATYFASLGNILSARNQAKKIPVLQSNALGMAYGAGLMFTVALLLGAEVRFDNQASYIASWLYLSMFGSIVAFSCYLTLIGRIGADKAAYTSLVYPIIALQLSAWFESFQWSQSSLVGLALILLGNMIILSPKSLLGRFSKTALSQEVVSES